MSIIRNSVFVVLLLIGARVIVMVVRNPYFSSQRKTGSFEYVRKGESLFDKGDYRGAIKYFEIAHDSSPKNRIIKENLMWAYSKYAGELAGKEDYDKAIEYLTRAYEVMRHTSTIQNLAIMYSKRALSRARKGEHSKMLEDLEAARSITSDSGRATKNLSISLFNDAVDEYKSGRENNAIVLLKEASLAWEDSAIYELMGDIYYKKTGFARALFYWNKAKDLNPENKGLDVKKEKLDKEMKLAGTEKKIALPHFELRYEKGLPIGERLINEALEDAYMNVGKDLEYYPSSRTVVFFYSEDKFRDIFKLPRIVRAFYDGNIRMPFPAQGLDETEARRYIFHEYTHAIVSAKTNNNCPAWFSEGIAVWEEMKGRHAVARELISKIGMRGAVSFKSLEDSFKAMDEHDANMRYYYLMAYTMVKYIVDTWGLEGLRDILERVAGGQHVVNAIDDEFLLSEKEFEKRWNAHE